MLATATHCQLLVVDIQERLARAMPESVLQQAVHNSSILLQAANLLQLPVLHTEQYPKGLGATLNGIAAHLPDACQHFEKTAFSCCATEGFNACLTSNGRSQVVITGMETHVCVLQTALDLQASGQQVFVVADAVCSRHHFNHLNALARMQAAGVSIVSTESILFEWLRDASHEHFKTLSRLIR